MTFDDMMETPGEDRIHWLIHEIDHHEAVLTSSENELFADLSSAFKRRGTLSEKQVQVLEKFKERLNDRA
jgi:hypothetical protein